MLETIAKIQKHIRCVQEAMRHCVDELHNRAFAHDASKFQSDELIGYARFEEMPEGLEYGSEAHKEAMAKVMEGNNCFELHSTRNDHHPEHYEMSESDLPFVTQMGLFPLMEMVCDWAGAHLAYNNKGGWLKSVEVNIERHNFSICQRWVIHQVSDFLMRKIPELQNEIEQ